MWQFILTTYFGVWHLEHNVFCFFFKFYDTKVVTLTLVCFCCFIHQTCTLCSGGCYAPIVDASSPYVLDPCNCSSYYQRIQHPTPGRERKLCPTDQLWNYKVNQCRSSESVVDGRLCERGSPWSRCINITGEQN